MEVCLQTDPRSQRPYVPARFRCFFPLTDRPAARAPGSREPSHPPPTDRKRLAYTFHSFRSNSRHASRHPHRPTRRAWPATGAAVCVGASSGLAGPGIDGADRRRTGVGNWLDLSGQRRSAPGPDLSIRGFGETSDPLPAMVPEDAPGTDRGSVRGPRRVASRLPLHAPQWDGTIAADSSKRAAANPPSAGAFEEWLA